MPPTYPDTERYPEYDDGSGYPTQARPVQQMSSPQRVQQQRVQA